MSIFSNKWLILQAYFFILLNTFLLVFLCSIIYTILPLKIQILPIFANFSLGLAVFFGSIYLSRKTPFFHFKNVIFLTTLLILTFFILSFFFGELNGSILLQKGILIITATLFGEIGGKL